MSTDDSNEFDERSETRSRLEDLTENGKGYVVLVTRAFGPNGEDLIDEDGPKFSGEPGIRVHVEQGDKEEDVLLSPFFGDPSKVWTEDFEEGKRCKLTVPETGEELDSIPGMNSEEGGKYYAIYLTEDLEDGELVAVNDMWGNYNSRILSEDELLRLYADMEAPEEEQPSE